MIIVTGGLGYIGSHICKQFLEDRKDVAIIDNADHFSARYNKVLAQLKKIGFKEENLFNIDLRNTDDVRNAVKTLALNYNIDAVCHLAGLISVAESIKEPDLYYENNVIGSRNLFDAMKEFDINRLLFASTAAVYGNGETSTEVDLRDLKPINPYGRTKLMIEKELMYNRSYDNFRTTIFRFFNAAGASSDSTIGEMHENESHLIPLILKTVNTNNTFKIFGNDYKTKDGTCIRDYIHVSDIADYFYDSLKENILGTINLGTKTGYSIYDIIKTVEEVTGYKVNYEICERRSGDPDKLVPNDVFSDYTGKNKDIRSLETIINDAWNWEKKYFRRER